MKKKVIFILLLIALLPFALASQTDSASIYKKRKHILWTSAATGYAASMTFLYHSWYKNHEQSSFHFINDSKEWNLQDKAGHTISSYYITNYTYKTYRWAGYDRNQAVWMAGASGFFYQTVIEVLDGFSAKWGASYTDLLANTTGSFLYIGQKKLWNEQRIILKYSYHDTKVSEYRPDLLGSNLAEKILKDYNAHTYWLSGNLEQLFPEIHFPPWLNLAIGYNAYGMTGGEKNVHYFNGKPVPDYKRTSRVLIAPDIDFKKIRTKYRFLNFVFEAFQFIKAPAPAIEYNGREGIRFHLMYF